MPKHAKPEAGEMDMSKVAELLEQPAERIEAVVVIGLIHPATEDDTHGYAWTTNLPSAGAVALLMDAVEQRMMSMILEGMVPDDASAIDGI